MTSAVPGHGYRSTETIVPSCKCGWRGSPVGPMPGGEADDHARAAFERHKETVRHRTGYEAPSDRAHREFKAAGVKRRPALRIVR